MLEATSKLKRKQGRRGCDLSHVAEKDPQEKVTFKRGFEEGEAACLRGDMVEGSNSSAKA